MCPNDDITSIGGVERHFPETQWTQICDSKQCQAALHQVLERYWKPLYFYLRRKGFNNDRAKDLTQGFFAQVLIGRGLVDKADRERGKFRNLLLVALENYVKSVHRPKKHQLIAGAIPIVDIDIPSRAPEDPTQAFMYAWAANLIDVSLADLREECVSDGQEVHWTIFNARFLRPMWENIRPPSLAALCAEHRISGEAKASNMIVTVKRRFRRILKRRIGQYVESEAQIEHEIHDIITILSQGGAVC